MFGLAGWAAATITITPTYVDGAGESWTIARQAVIEHAISDWQDVLAAPAAEGSVTINVTIDFANAGTGGYLGQWSGAWSGVTVGSDTRPWLNTTHAIHFNADRMDTGLANYLWWDATPDDGGDQPFVAWDAVSVARHEIGHMLGFNANLYWDDIQSGSTAGAKPWQDLITIDGSTATFDLGGMDVSMASTTNVGHLLDAGETTDDLMVPALVNGDRRDISTTDAEMLSLAYDYQIIPEPATGGLFASVLLCGIGRRRRPA